MKRKNKVKKAIKKAMPYILGTALIIAFTLLIAYNGKVCYGDYEGDINAVCVKIVK